MHGGLQVVHAFQRMGILRKFKQIKGSYNDSKLKYFSTKPYGVTIHSNRLDETIRMNVTS